MVRAKTRCRRFYGILLAGACCVAYGHAQAQGLTQRVPECKLPATKPLPDKYLMLAKRHKDFAWAAKVGREDAMVSRGGWERHEGLGMRDWFGFYRIDINNDGHCDWYLNVGTPLSTGGDRDSINTIYLGRPGGWLRIGASIPNDKPDQLGSGKAAAAEQQKYLFGEEPGVIYDASQKISYLITALYKRHDGRSSMPGYRVLTRDAAGKTLRALDKWQPGSKAAEVYAYFKKNGAHTMPVRGQKPDEAVLHFDREVEAFELEQACADPADAAGPGPEPEGAVSPHLLATCKRPRADAPELGRAAWNRTTGIPVIAARLS